MTDQFKQRIIEYLTGNYTIEQRSEMPIFKDFKYREVTESIYNEFNEILGYIQGKDKNNNELPIGIVYGNDYYNKGIIIIVDNQFNILKIIKNFNTGAEFQNFISLNIDEKGQIYGIDYDGSRYRFILLNNLFIKLDIQEYVIKLRNSYFIDIPVITGTYTSVDFIEKNPNSSTYFIIGGCFKTYESYRKPYVLKYTINVGSENELIQYDYNDTSSNSYIVCTNNIIYTGENYQVKLGAYYNRTIDGETRCYYNEFELDQNDTSLRKTLDSLLLPESLSSEKAYDNPNKMIITNTNTYYSYVENIDSSFYQKYNIAKLNYLTKTFEILFSNENDIFLTSAFMLGLIIKKNNKIAFYSIKNNNSPAILEATNYTVTFGIIDGDNIYYKESDEVYYLYNFILDGLVLFNINITYNLVEYILYGTENTIISAKQVYNQFNYNYEDFQTLNSMIPKSGLLYDENNEIIFARNLYNRTSFGDTTLSVMELPNTLLNNINISKQELLSETNSALIENLQNIITNIYETLNINFYNKLSIQNRNIQEDIKNNVDGATRLNLSISQELDYEDNMIKKYKVIFDDETFKIYNLSIPEQVNEKKYRYRFGVYVPTNKNITNIQLLSNDENTIYQDITNIELENNKFYTLTQDVEII